MFALAATNEKFFQSLKFSKYRKGKLFKPSQKILNLRIPGFVEFLGLFCHLFYLTVLDIYFKRYILSKLKGQTTPLHIYFIKPTFFKQ